MAAPRKTGNALHFDELYPALGKLLVASGRMEMQIRALVSWLAGDDEAGWIVFEGQSVEWLTSTGKAILGVLPRGRLKPEQVDAIIKTFEAAQKLNRLRNFYVHGDWGTTCLHDECMTRARTLPPDDRQFHVARSRYKDGFEERVIAVSDVEAHAMKINDLANDLRVMRKAIGDMLWGSTELDL